MYRPHNSMTPANALPYQRHHVLALRHLGRIFEQHRDSPSLYRTPKCQLLLNEPGWDALKWGMIFPTAQPGLHFHPEYYSNSFRR